MSIENLKKLPFIKKVFYYKTVISTNSLAMEKIDNDEFTVFITDNQTSGKGRNNREWFSPKDENLYFSFILKPDILLEYFSPIPIITAYSVYETLKKYISKKIFIKWPNDILIEDRKISGILIEINGRNMVVGVGINTHSKNFPKFEKNSPTSIYLETGYFYDKFEILGDFFENFYKNYNIFLTQKTIPATLLKNIESILKFRNQTVEVVFKNHIKKGIVKGITKEGYLRLDNEIIHAGDVLKLN